MQPPYREAGRGRAALNLCSRALRSGFQEQGLGLGMRYRVEGLGFWFQGTGYTGLIIVGQAAISKFSGSCSMILN